MNLSACEMILKFILFVFSKKVFFCDFVILVITLLEVFAVLIRNPDRFSVRYCIWTPVYIPMNQYSRSAYLYPILSHSGTFEQILDIEFE